MLRSTCYKIVVLGDPKAGKSAFVKRFVEGGYSETYMQRQGVDFTSKTVRISETLEAQLQFWDICGITRVADQDNALSTYLRSAEGAIIMYDASDPVGKANVAKWKELLDTKVTVGGEAHKPPAVLVANKLDLVCSNSDEYDREELHATRDTLGFVAAYPCSVKANWNVNPVIACLVQKMAELSSSKDFTDLQDYVDLLEPPAPASGDAKCSLQ